MGRLEKGQGRLVPAVVLSAKEEAAAILARARTDEASLRARLDDLRAEAQRRGYEDGLAAARADVEATLLQAKDAALTLARHMAEKIVGRAIDLSPGSLADIVDRAVAQVRTTIGAVVRVHPDHLPVMHAEASVQVRPDPSVGRYGCVVDTPAGRVDARLRTQLDALEAALRRSLTSPSS